MGVKSDCLGMQYTQAVIILLIIQRKQKQY